MKILSLNSSDTFGGAARAAYRLQGALRDLGVDAQMLVQRKFTDNSFVIGPDTAWHRGLGLARNKIDSLPFHLMGKRRDSHFSLSIIPSDTVSRISDLQPDLLHLHWICEGLASIGSLARLKVPTIWTLHDSWPFTGGCHVPNECTAYQKQCGYCPQLSLPLSFDLSHIGWLRKKRMLNRLKPVVVSPSNWLAGCAANSSLMRNLRIEVIPNGVDTNIFKPSGKVISRRLLGINEDKKILLFSAIDGIRHHHKGFHLLKQALEVCSQKDDFRESVVLYIAGSSTPADIPDLPIPVRFIGQLHDDVSIALLYNIADLFVAPALLENFSNTVLESMACGTPCVAFNAGGMSDLIEHGINGYLANAYNIREFAEAIVCSINNDQHLSVLSDNGRRKVEEFFSLDKVARHYIRLYEEIWTQFPS